MPKLPNHAERAKRIKRLEGLLGKLEPVPEEWTKYAKKYEGDGLDCLAKLTTKTLDQVEPETVQWVWENRLVRNKTNLLYGDPDTGKTWLALDIIARVTRGRKFPDGAKPPRMEILFVTAEDGVADTIRPRIDMLKGDPTSVHVLDIVDVDGRERTLDLGKHLGAIEEWLDCNRTVGMLVLDPLTAFLGNVNAHRDNLVRALLKPLATLAEKRRLTVLAISHLRKGEGKALYRCINSVGFVAAARAVWLVGRDPEDETRSLFLPIKNNLSPRKPKGLAFRLEEGKGLVWQKGDVETTADQAIDAEHTSARSETKQWLAEQLKNGPYPSGALERKAKDDGICWRTVKDVKKELGVISKRDGKTGQWSFMYNGARGGARG